MSKKKVIIIGSGISGLTAGIYLLDNGFDVTIYEKHFLPGGECTGWYRKNHYIDGCAHWIDGTNPKDQLFKLWKHIGAFDENSTIYNMDYLAKFEYGDKVYTLYSDINDLKKELLSISKEDKRQINKFIRTIKRFCLTSIPTIKPIDMMNIFELISFGIRFLPMALSFKKYSNMSVEEYSKRFKSKVIQDMLNRWLNKNYKMSSFFYVLQEAYKKNAGVVKGGSLEMSNRIANTFKNLGGKIFYDKEVSKILVENNVAKGVLFADGSKEKADYIVPACDIHHTFYDLLDNKYTPKYFSDRFNNVKSNPLNCAIYLSFKVTKDLSKQPKMMDYKCEGFNIGEIKLNHIQVRNYSFDDTYIKDGETLISIIVPSSEDVYIKLKSLSKADYNKEKENIASSIKNLLIEKMHLSDKEIVLLDIATPLTYERYLNAYHGSYMAFVNLPKHKGLMQKGTIKNLKHLVIASQWLMPPGGLPIALFLGKHAAIRICKEEKIRFKNKEEKSVTNKNTKEKK